MHLQVTASRDFAHHLTVVEGTSSEAVDNMFDRSKTAPVDEVSCWISCPGGGGGIPSCVVIDCPLKWTTPLKNACHCHASYTDLAVSQTLGWNLVDVRQHGIMRSIHGQIFARADETSEIAAGSGK